MPLKTYKVGATPRDRLAFKRTNAKRPRRYSVTWDFRARMETRRWRRHVDEEVERDLERDLERISPRRRRPCLV